MKDARWLIDIDTDTIYTYNAELARRSNMRDISIDAVNEKLKQEPLPETEKKGVIDKKVVDLEEPIKPVVEEKKEVTLSRMSKAELLALLEKDYKLTDFKDPVTRDFLIDKVIYLRKTRPKK